MTMERRSILIKDTTREEREQIVKNFDLTIDQSEDIKEVGTGE